MARVARPQARRDFLLDSGALTSLAAADAQAKAWIAHITKDYDDAAILVPIVVLTETVTGHPADAKLNRFFKNISDPDDAGGFLLDLTPEIARHERSPRQGHHRGGRSVSKSKLPMLRSVRTKRENGACSSNQPSMM